MVQRFDSVRFRCEGLVQLVRLLEFGSIGFGLLLVFELVLVRYGSVRLLEFGSVGLVRIYRVTTATKVANKPCEQLEVEPDRQSGRRAWSRLVLAISEIMCLSFSCGQDIFKQYIFT